MELQLIKSGENRYKIISKSSKKHPALIHLAEIVKDANRYSDIKIGIYNVTGGEFSSFKSIYSYISKRIDRMNKKSFYKFLKGKRQIKQKKNTMNDWKPINCSEKILDFLND